MAPHHGPAVRFCRLRILAQRCMRLAEIILGRLFFRPRARRQFEARNRIRCLARTQQIDAQQQIGKIILRLQFSRTLQDRQSLRESRLLMKSEALFEQRLELLLACIRRAVAVLGARRDAHCKHQPQPET